MARPLCARRPGPPKASGGWRRSYLAVAAAAVSATSLLGTHTVACTLNPAAPAGGPQRKTVYLRVCCKCINQRGFDPRPAMQAHLEQNQAEDAAELPAGTKVVVDGGSCMGACPKGPNVKMLLQSGADRDSIRVRTANSMTDYEKTYRCIQGVRSEEAAARACDLAYELVNEDADPAS
eukprot:TRINITY_DN65231_c0_g1_i1.p1 TRINITY_DN65231_c0_g1~~TRINITY_DN65231_c0_g1_i1.p1  ORF type:complete len:192 (-),score=32.67 TRINITY_DN65231_c0_g1_i1:623-1156(-)